MSRYSRRENSRARVWVWSVAAGLALTLSWGSTAAAQAPGSGGGLPGTIDRILADQRLAGGAASVVVQDAATGDLVYSHRPTDRLMPASNTKVLTSTAAMDLLGPGYRFRTDVLTDGTRHGTSLVGDVYLRGTGDPTMLAADYDKLAARIADSGVRRVTGRLVADDTRFDSVRLGRNWAGDDESAYYSSQISALTVAPDTDYDAGNVYILAKPGAKPGDPPKVTVTPPTDYVTVDVRATTVASDAADTLTVEREHGRNTIVVSGGIPVGADPDESWTSVWEPTGYAAAVFADALADHGVKVVGRTRLGRATPPDAKVLAAHRSMTLAKMYVPFMKLSNNNHAEVLTKAVGYETAGKGTWEAGLAAIRKYLKGAGVDTGTLRQVDGSGLSRMDVVPSRELVTLLSAVRSEPWFRDWYASLPVACDPDRMVGGTLRTRMCDTPAAGNVHAKTGSMTGVSALSGYVKDADGRELVFSIVLNNFLVDSVKDIEDKVVVALASSGADGGGDRAVRRSADSGTSQPLECAWLKPAPC